MTERELIHALGDIPDRYILQADPAQDGGPEAAHSMEQEITEKRSGYSRLKRAAAAACLALAAGAGFWMWRSFGGGATAAPTAPPAAIEEHRGLTAEEVERVNAAFAVLAEPEDGAEAAVNPLCCFLTSCYSDVRELDFAQFLACLPGGGTLAAGEDDDEFRALAALPGFPFGAVSLDDMPVPVHRHTREGVDEILGRYAGITAGELTDTDSVLRLPEYDAWYSFTSDFGLGGFICTGGRIEGETVYLWSDSSDGAGTELTLLRDGAQWHIKSFLPIEAEPSAGGGSIGITGGADGPTAIFVAEPSAGAEAPGVTVAAKHVTRTGMTAVFTRSGEGPTGELLTGSRYWIDRWTGKRWEAVETPIPPEEIVWTEEAYGIGKDGATELDVDWSFLYGELPDGSYRLGKEIMDWRAPGDFDSYAVCIRFELPAGSGAGPLD